MKIYPLIATLLATIPSSLTAAPVGIFEEATDVGKIELKGSSEFLPDKNRYRITGSGKNIWFAEDAFQFLSKKMSGDLVFSMDTAWEAEGKEPHRKACAMVRQTLDPDSPYVDVAVHGDGLIEMQYRIAKGATTLAARTPVQAPATVKLERDGDVFTASVSKDGGPFQPIGAVSLAMPDPVYVGIGVGAHNAVNLETALLSNVGLTNRIPLEAEKRVRETTLETLDITTAERRIVYRDRSLFEAPNWSPDGKLFYFNRTGRIWTLPVSGGEPALLDTGAAIKNNNDHGLSADGKWLAISSGSGENGSKIYVVPATGGEAREITPTGPSYWHGWSPDGKTLTYCAKRNDNYDVYTIPSAGGPETRLTDAAGLDDGPEYTSDGRSILFHSERDGPAKLWRMNPDGTGQTQITSDEAYADWFPHPSPDGKWIVFVCFDKSVKGHPSDKNVVIRLMPIAGGKPKVIATLFGGQGTLMSRPGLRTAPKSPSSATAISFPEPYPHMIAQSNRRAFLKYTSFLPFAAIAAWPVSAPPPRSPIKRAGGPHIKTSLNAYSFLELLNANAKDPSQGRRSVRSATSAPEVNFDAVDLTGYFFPGYPKAPEDNYLIRLKRHAFNLGLDISGTGVRNDFTAADKSVRAEGVQRIKTWIEVAAKLGAPDHRAFADSQPPFKNWQQAVRQRLRAKPSKPGSPTRCASAPMHGKKFGVIVAVQNHGDFISTGEQHLSLLNRVDHRVVRRHGRHRQIPHAGSLRRHRPDGALRGELADQGTTGTPADSPRTDMKKLVTHHPAVRLPRLRSHRNPGFRPEGL